MRQQHTEPAQHRDWPVQLTRLQKHCGVGDRYRAIARIIIGNMALRNAGLHNLPVRCYLSAFFFLNMNVPANPPPGHIAVIARLRGQWVVRLLGGVGRLNGVLGCRIAAPLSGQCGVSGHSQLVTRVIGIFAIAPAGKGIAVAGGGQL